MCVCACVFLCIRLRCITQACTTQTRSYAHPDHSPPIIMHTRYHTAVHNSSMRRCTCHSMQQHMRRYTRDKHSHSCVHRLHMHQQHIPTCIVYSHLHACIKAMIVHSSFTYYIERLKSAVHHSSMRWCTCHNIQQSMRRYIHNKHARSCVHRLHVHRL